MNARSRYQARTAHGLDIDHRRGRLKTFWRPTLSLLIGVEFEVVEHVNDLPSFLNTTAQLVKGGYQVVATINRNLSGLVAILVLNTYLVYCLRERISIPTQTCRLRSTDEFRTVPAEFTGVQFNLCKACQRHLAYLD